MMGKFLRRFKRLPEQSKQLANNVEADYHRHKEKKEKRERRDNNMYGMFDGADDNFNDALIDGFKDDFKDDMNGYGMYNETNIQPSQKPESFHHFILENQYKDLERSIRGFKDVYNQKEQKWILIRKTPHCFTDSEAEDILRTAQSHLATDIKLGYVSKDVIGAYMDAIYDEIAFIFESIAEYRYGRYGDETIQYEMKIQNHKIFLELMTRIQANYSRSIGGMENKYTHDSVKGQESLQQSDRFDDRKRFYS